MSKFPDKPISPSEFMEVWLPRAFVDAELPRDAQEARGKLGVALLGEGGGEWLFEVDSGDLQVVEGSRNEALFSVVQSVEDWRGALWEGRGGSMGKQASRLFQPGTQQAWKPGELGGVPTPAALEEIGKLDGLIRVEVTGGIGGDWAVEFRIGPGAIPKDPTATLSMTSEDAEAIDRGELDPMQAFMSGKMLVTGDMSLVMQVQAIQMQVAIGASRPTS